MLCKSSARRMTRCCAWAAMALAVIIANDRVAISGINFGARPVGGVSIDADGVLTNQVEADTEAIVRAMQERVGVAPEDMRPGTELRMISLRGLEAAIADALQNNDGILPDEVTYLAGLQRIEFVIVDPENNDIVLAGPAEGWQVNELGEVVGITTGRPVLLLDDLIVAFRTVEAARQGRLSCSIDPTAEGRLNMQAYLDQQRVFTPQVIDGIAQSLGPQQITITGVAPETHFARILVAADFHMKQLAMKLVPSPVPGLSSYLDMVRGNVRNNNMMPRWWLACNYDQLLRSEDGLLWQIRGQGVKCMTEEDFIAEDGSVEAAGQTSAPAQRWADAFTENFDELSQRNPAFAHLRNIMDMCIVGALLQHEDLLGRAGCTFPLLMTDHSDLRPIELRVPQTIDTQVSFVKRGRNYIISASGGVLIESWLMASRSEVGDKMEATSARVIRPDDAKWWWNPAS